MALDTDQYFINLMASTALENVRSNNIGGKRASPFCGKEETAKEVIVHDSTQMIYSFTKFISSISAQPGPLRQLTIKTKHYIKKTP